MSGNPFAADSDVWRAASAPVTPTTPAQAPFSSHAPADPFAAAPKQQHDPFGGQQPPAALRQQEHSFAELNPTAGVRPRGQAQPSVSRTHSVASTASQPPLPHGGYGSQAATPRGDAAYGQAPLSGHAQPQQPGAPPTHAQHGWQGFGSQPGPHAAFPGQPLGPQPGFPVAFTEAHGPGRPLAPTQGPPPAAHPTVLLGQQQPSSGSFAGGAPAFGAPTPLQQPPDRSQPFDFGFSPLEGLQQGGFPARPGGQPFAAPQPQPQPAAGGEPGATVADERLWDFASLHTLRPQLRSRAAAPGPTKESLRPMRPAADGSWVQPWAQFDAPPLQPAAPPPQQPQPQPQPAPQQQQPQAPQGAAERPPPTAASAPASAPAWQPAAAAPAAAARVPWALPPPAKDSPRPAPAAAASGGAQQNGGGRQAFGRQPQQPKPPQQQRADDTSGDEELARKLQEMWGREGGAPPPASPPAHDPARSPHGPPTKLSRPSKVAGVVPPELLPPLSSRAGGPPGAAQAPAGGGGATSSWQHFSQGTHAPQWTESAPSGGASAGRAAAFLHKTGGWGGAGGQDEAYARKLQQEYDSEHAASLQPPPAAQQQGGATGYPAGFGAAQQQPQPQHGSTAEDAALAQRLQQEEIARQQQGRQGWPAQQPGWQQPQQPGWQQQPPWPQQPPQQAPPQPWWSAPAQQQQQQPQQQQQQSQASAGRSGSSQQDEEYARQLQRQFDAEDRANPAGGGGSISNVAPQQQQQLQPRPSAPSWRQRLDRLVAGPAPDICRGCQQPISGLLGSSWSTALGAKWHPGCLRCSGCERPITDASLAEHEGKPYHVACHKEAFHPRCCVCGDFCPEQGGQIRWTTDAFWRLKACPRHTSDGTPRCAACTRLQRAGQEWPAVSAEDGRRLCLDCLGSVVVDAVDAQPLYAEVLRFYREAGFPLPVQPPLLLVEPSALEGAEVREGRAAAGPDAPVFHTRGLTLSTEYRSIQTVVRPAGAPLLGARQQAVHVPGASHCEVTAILVLAGLPRLLAGSILAHECMHAWLRLGGTHRLPLEVEEGLCQLMALLWVERAAGGLQPGGWEARLAAYCAHAIRTEPSPVYGDGFRAALDAHQRVGLRELVRCVRASGRFP